MNSLLIKFRLILHPYLAVLGALLLGYTFLNWFLIIKTEWLSINEFIVDLIAPMVLVGIVVLIWIRPRTKLLKLDTMRGGYYDLYAF